MHHHDDGTFLAWLLYALGSLAAFLQGYGMGIVSLVVMLGGLVIQWKTYRLRERELALKLKDAAAR